MIVITQTSVAYAHHEAIQYHKVLLPVSYGTCFPCRLVLISLPEHVTATAWSGMYPRVHSFHCLLFVQTTCDRRWDSMAGLPSGLHSLDAD